MIATTGPVHLTLACHPQGPTQAIRAIDVAAGGTSGGGLTLAFTLEGELSAVRIPEPRPSRRKDGLWLHTCFEAFVMAGEGPGYREYNFSPSGEWAVYAFRGYRDGGEPEVGPGPEIALRRSGDRLALEAEIPRQCLPSARSLRLGLAAVVEDAHGAPSYWALRHPPGKPDFHHADAFTLQLDLPGMHDANMLIDRVRP